MDNLKEFGSAWSKFYGDCQPLGHLLRGSHFPWVRFYALPAGKRLPENSDEEKVVIKRANSIAEYVLGNDAPCWQVMAEWDKIEDESYSIIVDHVVWKKGAFDKQILDIALDRDESCVWISKGSGSVFAPYDGGFDIFMQSEEGIAAVKERFFGWASDHPLGL